MKTPTRRYIDPITGRGAYQQNGQTQPHVVVISTDMVPVDFHRTDRAQTVNTPHIDSLCRLKFDRAFATSPLCSPSRAAYMTGRHSYITTNSERAHDGHAIHLRPEEIIFPQYLRAAGYHARHVGKCHVGAAKFLEAFGENDAPWDRWSPPWRDDDDYVSFLRQRGLERFEFEREITGTDLTGEGKGNSYGGWIAPQNGSAFPKDATYPAFLAQKAMDAIDARNPDQPLYLQLDFFGPHQPFAIPGGMEAREAEIRQGIELPASYPGVDAPSDSNPRVYDVYRRNWGLTVAETILEYRIANQLQYELIDEMIGRVLDHLRSKGLFDESWIFFLGDHGEMNGEAGLVDKGAYLHPRVVQAPLGCRPPNDADRAATTIDTPVSLLDLAPTILDLAGVTPDARLDGFSLLDTAAGQTRPDECPIMFEVWSHVIPNPCVGTILCEEGVPYLFAFNACDPVDELYELGADAMPRNLALTDAARREAAVRTMHKRLAADERWKSYRGFLEITYPEEIQAGGDRQLFV